MTIFKGHCVLEQRKAPDPQGLLHTSFEEARSATEVHWPEWACGGRMRMGLTPSLAHRGPVGTRGPERVAGTRTLSALWSLPTCARGRSGGHAVKGPVEARGAPPPAAGGGPEAPHPQRECCRSGTPEARSQGFRPVTSWTVSPQVHKPGP